MTKIIVQPCCRYTNNIIFGARNTVMKVKFLIPKDFDIFDKKKYRKNFVNVCWTGQHHSC